MVPLTPKALNLLTEIVETGVNPGRLPSANTVQYLADNMNFVKGSGSFNQPVGGKSKRELARMFDTPTESFSIRSLDILGELKKAGWP